MSEGSSLGGLFRSLFIGLVRLFRLVVYIVLMMVSILNVVFLNQTGCGFKPPSKKAAETAATAAKKTAAVTTIASTEFEKKIPALPIYGTFPYGICLSLSIFHSFWVLPLTLFLIGYICCILCCIKATKSYIFCRRVEMGFLIANSITTLLMLIACSLLEYMLRHCTSCADTKSTNKLVQKIQMASTIGWFGLALWISQIALSTTTFCIYKDLLKQTGGKDAS